MKEAIVRLSEGEIPQNDNVPARVKSPIVRALVKFYGDGKKLGGIQKSIDERLIKEFSDPRAILRRDEANRAFNSCLKSVLRTPRD
jgi:hypothetical protein